MFKAPYSQALIALVAAAGLGISAMPAAAKASKSDDSATRISVKQKDGKTLYCVRATPKTGSILISNVCKSREDWAQAGLDIPADTRSADSNAAQPAG